MSTEKRKYSFYADEDVMEIIESWDAGGRSRELNEAVRQYVTKQVTVEKRLLRLEKQVKELQSHREQ